MSCSRSRRRRQPRCSGASCREEVEDDDVIASGSRRRTETVLEGLLQRGLRQTDRLFSVLMAAQWVFGIALSLWLSPWAWNGAERTVHLHVWAAIFLGGAITLPPWPPPI